MSDDDQSGENPAPDTEAQVEISGQLTLRAVWLEVDLVFFPAPLPSPLAPPFPLAPPLACPPSESAPISDPFDDADSDCPPPPGVCPF